MRHDPDQATRSDRAAFDVRPKMAAAAPGVGIAQPRLAAKKGFDLGEVEAHRGIGGRAVENAVVIEQRRDHEHVVELHVERPMGNAIFGRQQHPDDQLVIARDALRAHADIEGADAERKFPDADMRQRSAQPPTSELHHVDMGAVNGLVKTFETVQLFRINQKEMPHDCTLVPKRDNSAAGKSEIPLQREVVTAIRLRVLRQICGEYDAASAMHSTVH